MIQILRKSALVLTLACVLASMSVAHAYRPDPDLLDSKGFSPMTIKVVRAQTARAEWKKPPLRERTPSERFWHNVKINNWVGNLDPFGYTVIREYQ